MKNAKTMSKHGRNGMRCGLLLGTCALLAIAPPAASACTACVMAGVWSGWPPLLTISMVGYGWLLGVAIAMVWCDRRRWLRAFNLAAGGFVLFTATAPLGGFLLLGIAVIFALTTIVRTAMKHERPRFESVRLALGLAAVVAVGVIVTMGILRPTPHEPLDVILKWSGTAAERSAYRSLIEQQPVDLDALRRIVREGTGVTVRSSAEYLIEHGTGIEDDLIVVRRWRDDPTQSWSFEEADHLLSDKHRTGWAGPSTARQWHDWLTSATVHTTGTLTIGTLAQ